MKASSKLKDDWQSYLIEALREDLKSRESEITALRNSLRYRLGGWVLEAWPPGYRTVVVAARFAVALIRLRKGAKKSGSGRSLRHWDENQSRCGHEVLVFGKQCPDSWSAYKALCLDNASEVAAYLDSSSKPSTLIVTRSNQAIARRIERLKLEGWSVFWHRNPSESCTDPISHYIAAHSERPEHGSDL